MREPIQIRFGDIDRLGHVNNAVHAQYFDVGRVKFLYKYMPFLNFSDKTLVLVSLKNDFYLPILEHDTIFVDTYISSIGNRSVKMLQEIKDQDGKIKSVCNSVLSTLDMRTQSSFPMPDIWREALEKAEFYKS